MTVLAWGPGERPLDDPTPHYIRIAAYALCVLDGTILLVRIGPGDADAGRWTLPGGGLDFGEPPEVGALRELEEETGLVGEIGSLLAVDSEVYEPRPGRQSWLQSIRIVYRVHVTGGSLRDETDGSSDRCAWAALDEMSSYPLVGLAELGVGLARADRP
jgi:8-oxo-dGTP diphosphatase